ncbi:MAG: hypothetical protein V4582_06340 [Pseudomonadota bacterium]
MKIHRLLWVALAGGALAFSAGAGAADNKSHPVRCQGTYSSFEFNKEGGDLLGLEIKIVPAGEHFEAVVQSAQGEPGALFLATATCSKGRITISIPKQPDRPFVSLEGVVSKNGIKAQLNYEGGSVEKIFVPRRPGYWDR